jgi:hypothetical protein
MSLFPSRQRCDMKMKIEITIRLSEDGEVVRIETDQHTDEIQREKLDCLVGQIRDFCDWFRDEKRTLQ